MIRDLNLYKKPMLEKYMPMHTLDGQSDFVYSHGWIRSSDLSSRGDEYSVGFVLSFYDISVSSRTNRNFGYSVRGVKSNN